MELFKRIITWLRKVLEHKQHQPASQHMPVFARRFCPPKYVFFSGTDITPFYNDKPQPCITSVQWTYNCNAKSAYKVNGAITMSEWMPGPLNFDNPTDASSFLDAAMKNGKGTLVLVYKDEYGHTMRRTIEGIRAITISTIRK